MAATASALPPAGDFTVSPNPPNEDQAATFTCIPCPEGADVAWDFDGNLDFADATGVSAQHTFADAGLVTVRMRLRMDGEETVVPHDFRVNARPTVRFDFLPVNPLPGELVGFNQVIGDPEGDALTWTWRFGDATTSTLDDPQHAHVTPGTRTIELEVTDARGAMTTDTRQIAVQDPNGPGADFTFSPTVPLVGGVVTFTNTSTPSSGQSITGAVWDLDNDGEFDDSPAGWSFGIPGNHAVSVRVTQSNGKQDVKQRNIRVNAPPNAAFVWTPSTPVANESVDLISTSTDAEGPLTAQDWELDGDDDFNDATGPSASKAFPAGTHTVKLRVTDSDGVVRTVTRQLTILDLPNAAFTVSPGVPLVGEILTFANTSTASSGSLTQAVWDLDDDDQFDDNPAGWSFSARGNHRVSLKVTQTNGQTAVKELDIRVNAAPAVAFVWSPLTPVAGQATDLVSTSSDTEGVLSGQAWDLDGDGQFDDASGSTVSRAFPSAGNYDVGLQVTDSDGVVRTIRRAVTVSAAPILPAANESDEQRFIAPFPVVRLAGKVLSRGAVVRVLVVRAPRGALVRVRCEGNGCPVKAVRRRSKEGSVRFAQFERRLRVGVGLEIFVRQPGMIGKYTRFLVRAGEPPKRTDRCLFPGVQRPRACP